MRNLLATTAIVATAALPLAAQSQPGPQTIMDSVTGGNVTVAQLINRPVYVRSGSDTDVTWTGWTEVPAGFDLSGEIEDLLLNEQGRIASAIIGQGGILDIGETELQVDISQFGLVMDEDDRGEFFVVYTGDASDLGTSQPYQGLGDASTTAMRNAPEMNSENPAQNGGAATAPDAPGDDASEDGVTDTEVGYRWTSARQAQIEGAEPGGEYFGAAPAIERTGLVDVSVGSVTADELEWVPVYGQNNEWIGRIGDLALDENGDVSHVIVDMGGFMGIGETPVAVPFEKITLKEDKTEDLRAYVAMTVESVEQLKSAVSDR